MNRAVRWNIRFLGVVLISTVAAGCYSSEWHHSNTSRDNSIREDYQGGAVSSDPYRITERDQGGNWKAEQNSEQNAQGYSGSGR
jgi:hypothetical protein